MSQLTQIPTITFKQKHIVESIPALIILMILKEKTGELTNLLTELSNDDTWLKRSLWLLGTGEAVEGGAGGLELESTSSASFSVRENQRTIHKTYNIQQMLQRGHD